MTDERPTQVSPWQWHNKIRAMHPDVAAFAGHAILNPLDDLARLEFADRLLELSATIDHKTGLSIVPEAEPIANLLRMPGRYVIDRNAAIKESRHAKLHWRTEGSRGPWDKQSFMVLIAELARPRVPLCSVCQDVDSRRPAVYPMIAAEKVVVEDRIITHGRRGSLNETTEFRGWFCLAHTPVGLRVH